MSTDDLDTGPDLVNDSTPLSRRTLFVRGGLAAAGISMLGAPTAFAAAEAARIKVAVVTHGDTGSFWSVFKKGVDQAAKDLKGRGVSVTQVYANNDVAKQVAGINAAIAAGGQGVAAAGARAGAREGPPPKGPNKGSAGNTG